MGFFPLGAERWAMDFRWVAFITLWTILSGPVFGTATGTSSAPGKTEPSRAKKAEKKVSARQVR
jgi:hypothetical protein